MSEKDGLDVGVLTDTIEGESLESTDVAIDSTVSIVGVLAIPSGTSPLPSYVSIVDERDKERELACDTGVMFSWSEIGEIGERGTLDLCVCVNVYT